MTIRNLVINGSTKPAAASKPLDALEEFYYAFNHQDIEVMSRNWLQSPAIAMSNPLGGIKRGWDEIRPVYERIFTDTARVYVEYHDFDIVQVDTMFCVIGRERGWFRNGKEEIKLAIRTSRIYLLENQRWHQVHHHGSIDDPASLARYQAVVFSRLVQHV